VAGSTAAVAGSMAAVGSTAVTASEPSATKSWSQLPGLNRGPTVYEVGILANNP